MWSDIWYDRTNDCRCQSYHEWFCQSNVYLELSPFTQFPGTLAASLVTTYLRWSIYGNKHMQLGLVLWPFTFANDTDLSFAYTMFKTQKRWMLAIIDPCIYWHCRDTRLLAAVSRQLEQTEFNTRKPAWFNKFMMLTARCSCYCSQHIHRGRRIDDGGRGDTFLNSSSTVRCLKPGSRECNRPVYI